jgi:predicted NAD-dependent protein-ADP-ribosyltransferase YbiA (DUF1768 family)
MPESPGSPEDNSAYPGIDASDRIARKIVKPNGDVVRIFKSASVVVHPVGMLPRTQTPEGHLWNWVNGEAVESIPKRKIPPDKKPLNVASNGSEEIGRKLSNFADRPFVFHGKRYRSIEGWYQGLKWPDKKKRAEIAKLLGAAAKQAAKGAPKSEIFLYEGTEYTFGGLEHHALTKEAIRASLEQNPEIAEAFVLTHPRPIEHNTGREDKPGTALPGAKFAQMLEEIRSELLQARK